MISSYCIQLPQLVDILDERLLANLLLIGISMSCSLHSLYVAQRLALQLAVTRLAIFHMIVQVAMAVDQVETFLLFLGLAVTCFEVVCQLVLLIVVNHNLLYAVLVVVSIMTEHHLLLYLVDGLLLLNAALAVN